MNKRSAASSGRGDALRQKRAKVSAARSIASQPADAALHDGELDLDAFVAAHEFEMCSLEQSMTASRAAGASRAFQKVPRGLRRRTASHNPKRVPRRLRARARREMADDKTPTVEARRRRPRTTRARIRAEMAKRLGVLVARKRKKQQEQREQREHIESPEPDGVVGRKPRPKIRRNQLNLPPPPPARFRKRQANKTWLPTHQWHAKRARMTNPESPLWCFAVPLTPNDKIYRPTHRSQGERGTMLWDMSYMSTIGLYGNPAGMQRVLRSIGLSQASCWNDKGRRWRMGTRTWSGMLSREAGGDRRPVCPATVLWNPEQRGGQDARRPPTAQRQVYLRIHPSAFLDVFNELLRLTRMETPRLYIEDLRFEIGSLELTGPASTEALLAVLTPYTAKDAPKPVHATLFESLRGLTNPATLPANAVMSFAVQDPRLRYPPRRMDFPDDLEAQMVLLQTMAKWPAEDGLETSALFDRNARHRASCLPSQRSVNRRRGNAAPGSFVEPTRIDPPIPVILMASRSASATQTQGTWTLLAPWKCILPLWYSLVHVPLVSGLNPRFGGLHETMQVAFERSLPWFPADHVATDAGADWELQQRRKRRSDWEKRPKSKRTEWAAVDLGAGRRGEVGNGLACDFELLLGLSRAQREDTADGPDDADPEQRRPASTTDAEQPPPLKLLRFVSKHVFDSLVASPAPPPPPPHPHAVLTVRIALLARGVASPCARIYRLPAPPAPAASAEVPAALPPDLRAQWLAHPPPPPPGSAPSKLPLGLAGLESHKRLLALELIAPPAPPRCDAAGHPLVPAADDLVGFVTTGSFCLADGRAAAIGSIALHKVLPDVRADGREGRMCIVRNAGEGIGWLARWEIV